MHSFTACFVLLQAFGKWSVLQCIVLVHSFSLLHFSIWLHLSLFICSPSDGHLGGYAEILWSDIFVFLPQPVWTELSVTLKGSDTHTHTKLLYKLLQAQRKRERLMSELQLCILKKEPKWNTLKCFWWHCRQSFQICFKLSCFPQQICIIIIIIRIKKPNTNKD